MKTRIQDMEVPVKIQKYVSAMGPDCAALFDILTRRNSLLVTPEMMACVDIVIVASLSKGVRNALADYHRIIVNPEIKKWAKRPPPSRKPT